MVQSEEQITIFEHNKSVNSSDSFVRLTCCICRREILGSEKIDQCPRCQTYFHSKHLSIWLEIEKKCPICHCYLFQTKSKYPSLYTKDSVVKKGKFYRCHYCNQIWESKSLGHQLYCPECGITLCPHCKSAFSFDFLLRYIYSDGLCPKCNRYIVLESLKAKISVLKC